MKSRRLFSLIWRFNALVIFAVGVAGLLGLLLGGAMLYENMVLARQADSVINIAEQQVDKTTTSLGDFHAIEGSAILRAPLYLGQEYAYGVSSKTTNSIQNYLYFDPVSHASHWLIPGNRGLILEMTELPARDFERREPQSLEVIVYQLVDADTNADGKLASNDLQTIALSDPAGKRFVRLIGKVARVNGAHLFGKNALVVLYTSHGELRAAEVDMHSFKIVRESTLKPPKEIQPSIPAGAAASRPPAEPQR